MRSLSLFWGLRGHSMGVGIARSSMAAKCGVADGLRRLHTEIVPDSLGMRSCCVEWLLFWICQQAEIRDTAAWPKARRKTVLRSIVSKQANEHISRYRIRLVIAVKA